MSRSEVSVLEVRRICDTEAVVLTDIGRITGTKGTGFPRGQHTRYYPTVCLISYSTVVMELHSQLLIQDGALLRHHRRSTNKSYTQ